jgi:hypothetical protein
MKKVGQRQKVMKKVGLWQKNPLGQGKEVCLIPFGAPQEGAKGGIK